MWPGSSTGCTVAACAGSAAPLIHCQAKGKDSRRSTGQQQRDTRAEEAAAILRRLRRQPIVLTTHAEERLRNRQDQSSQAWEPQISCMVALVICWQVGDPASPGTALPACLPGLMQAHEHGRCAACAAARPAQLEAVQVWGQALACLRAGGPWRTDKPGHWGGRGRSCKRQYCSRRRTGDLRGHAGQRPCRTSIKSDGLVSNSGGGSGVGSSTRCSRGRSGSLRSPRFARSVVPTARSPAEGAVCSKRR